MVVQSVAVETTRAMSVAMIAVLERFRDEQTYGRLNIHVTFLDALRRSER
jgi:hypothetical protein